MYMYVQASMELHSVHLEGWIHSVHLKGWMHSVNLKGYTVCIWSKREF